jgi:glycerol-3-phosphate cytidylyltransferase
MPDMLKCWKMLKTMRLFNCRFTTDPQLTAQRKNRPTQSVVERYIQLKGCVHGWNQPYATEQDLEDILRSFKIDVRIIGDEYQDKKFYRSLLWRKRNSLAFHARSSFSSSSLAEKLPRKKILRIYKVNRLSFIDFRPFHERTTNNVNEQRIKIWKRKHSITHVILTEEFEALMAVVKSQPKQYLDILMENPCLKWP